MCWRCAISALETKTRYKKQIKLFKSVHQLLCLVCVVFTRHPCVLHTWRILCTKKCSSTRTLTLFQGLCTIGDETNISLVYTRKHEHIVWRGESASNLLTRSNSNTRIVALNYTIQHYKATMTIRIVMY